MLLNVCLSMTNQDRYLQRVWFRLGTAIFRPLEGLHFQGFLLPFKTILGLYTGLQPTTLGVEDTRLTTAPKLAPQLLSCYFVCFQNEYSNVQSFNTLKQDLKKLQTFSFLKEFRTFLYAYFRWSVDWEYINFGSCDNQHCGTKCIHNSLLQV